MNEVEVTGPTIATPEPSPTLPAVKVTLTKVSNGFLVEPKDKHWNGVESVYLDLDGALEEVRKSLS